MAWFKKARKKIKAPTEKPSRVPEGLMVKCPGCGQILYNKDLTTNLNVCHKCAHHFRMNATERLRMLFDDAWVEYDRGRVSTDPLRCADPKALTGFAGPRVIEQTIRQKLPEGFQRSEFLLEKGMLDLVVDRRDMKATIARALRFMGAARQGA